MGWHAVKVHQLTKNQKHIAKCCKNNHVERKEEENRI